ncbi:RAP protein, putative [Plasmodium gallinaceum]|uniref:RAP protein, putative n=1 Tax=Plasmodium gallinaceum TaxID=5849 RepID=A0A1J1GN53_PLAGA|nr:RAP protein, putative [Plasmodium gallinaceum]CRG93866.1 RAP protein, putative [Plasmodium gallinaceum]
MFFRILKNYKITSSIKREKSKCIFFMYFKKKSLSSSKKNDNFLKNLCNKNVINNLDSLNIIENLKYVSDNNVNKDVVKIYVNRIKLLNENWNLNKIYYILKALKKYEIYDVVLIKKLENIIDQIDLYEKADIDYFENIYIIRISYILQTFYYFNHTNEKVVKKLIKILNNKLDYIIYHNNYFNNFLCKLRQTNKNENNNKYNLNIIINNDNNLKFEKKKNENIFVRNINFNEIYLILNVLKKLKFVNKDFVNKLKFLYYFNHIDVDKTNENDYKYITLLFNSFYENTDNYLLNIMTLFLSKYTDMHNIHDLVLILVTVYYSKIEKKENEAELSSTKKNYKIKYPPSDDIISIIESIAFLSEEQKKNLKYILFCICRCGVKRDDLSEIIYDKVLALLNLKYQNDLNKRISNFSRKENGKSEKTFKTSEDTSCKNRIIKNITNDMQSLSELIKISNYSSKEVDILYYIYMKNFVEYFNIETILNIFKSFIFVYNMSNESVKNYNIYLKKRNRNILCHNLNNLMNIVILIITTKSLYRLYNISNINNLSYVLYFLYQISNIFENKIYEELYIKKLYDYINNVLIIKLKFILMENEEKNVNNIFTYSNLEKNDENCNNGAINNFINLNEYSHKKNKLYSKQKYNNHKNNDLLNNDENMYDGIVNEESCNNKNGEEDIVDSYCILFNLYSKKGDNKNIQIMLLKILQRLQIENKNFQTGIYVNLLNSFAKLKYRNMKLIEICLKRIDENSESLNFYEYINLLISLSKLNIFGINLNIYNALFSLKENNINSNCKYINKIFINEYNGVKKLNNIKIVYKLTNIFKKINENINNFVFFPSFKIINIIPNILNTYTILGFDKIHFKNINKLLECFYDYIFNYFEDCKLNGKDNNNIIDNPNNNNYNEINYNMNNTFNKNHYWYFSEKNNIIITKENNYRKLYLPLQCLYQLYIFNIYFNLYIKYLFNFYNDKDNPNVLMNDETTEDSSCLTNYLHNTNLYSMRKSNINDTKNHSFFNINNILSEKSIQLLNNIIFFVKYINNFYKNDNYKKYNLYMEYLNNYKNNDEKSTIRKKNSQLIENIKGFEIHVKMDNSKTNPSSFHRDVFSILKSLGVKNIECEVPFLDGIYTIDIIINNSICIEINGNNHYYYDSNMKRSYEKLDSLNLIKYYLLSKKYKLIIVSNFEWNHLKTVDQKKEFLKKKIEI